MAIARKLSPLARLIYTLQQEGVRFQIAGMSAAILQGVPSTTLDTHIWIDLPERFYFKILNLCRELDATVLARTVVALSDDTMVNFLYRVHGLRSFTIESKKAVRMRWLGMTVNVLPLSSIIRSKQFIRRPKNLAHLPLLRQTLRLKKKTKEC
jgi:hypothetical protein